MTQDEKAAYAAELAARAEAGRIKRERTLAEEAEQAARQAASDAAARARAERNAELQHERAVAARKAAKAAWDVRKDAYDAAMAAAEARKPPPPPTLISLDRNSVLARAARGVAGRTMQENIDARDKALRDA